MTDSKKTTKGKSPKKSKKLQLNKETIKDLGGNKTAQVKGGAPKPRCTYDDSGCGGNV